MRPILRPGSFGCTKLIEQGSGPYFERFGAVGSLAGQYLFEQLMDDETAIAAAADGSRDFSISRRMGNLVRQICGIGENLVVIRKRRCGW